MAQPLISPSTTPLHSSNPVSSFPIIAVAVIGICATAFLLVSYYIFVIKCCLNWQRIEILRRFSLSRRREQTLILRQQAEPRGLDPSTIQSIPLINYKKPINETTTTGGECAVCLTEFQTEEQLRKIPICSHLFHIDCIDIWLQNNSNCPLCRTSISNQNWLIPTNQAPSARDLALNTSIPISAGDENFVVIELGGNLDRCRPPELVSGEVAKSERKFKKVTSMGDECINMREKDEEFIVQPIRRSFSMDSSGDRQLYMAVQAAVREKSGGESGVEVEGCSSRVKRSFFSFGSGRGSRNAVLPIQFQP
ncbi:RING-H2 finger protein ATL16 [Cucumis sativus]|uniref:RING-type E3 ubiquitin transferase n=1 Tax=Cucumis sativus TaxID=3659 RepID=A0A0A0LNP5_CUCSA|nr:RING-H2 finger protein ATL16 [Cucumis sativus]